MRIKRYHTAKRARRARLFAKLFPELGDRLRMWRKAEGLTQKQIGEECGFSAGVIGGVEQGRRLPRGVNLRLLGRAYGVSSDYILGLSDSAKIHDPAITFKRKHVA